MTIDDHGSSKKLQAEQGQQHPGLASAVSFGGVPLIVDPLVPEGEVYLFQPGTKATIRVHEGPQAGEDLEIWLKRPWVVRGFNIDPTESLFKPGPPKEFKL